MLIHLIHSPLSELSREHCVAICSFLVPINLLITLQTLILATLNRPLALVKLSGGLSLPFALILMLHVVTWLIVGVIHSVTFILFTLALVCLTTNLTTLAYPLQVRAWTLSILTFLAHFLSLQHMENWLKQEVVR